METSEHEPNSLRGTEKKTKFKPRIKQSKGHIKQIQTNQVNKRFLVQPKFSDYSFLGKQSPEVQAFTLLGASGSNFATCIAPASDRVSGLDEQRHALAEFCPTQRGSAQHA